MATESELVSKMVRQLRNDFPDAVIFRLEDLMTAGIPDLVFNYKSHTIWFEAKVARPSFKITGVQLLTCGRLYREGFCFIIIFVEKTKQILIVSPDDVKNKSWLNLIKTPPRSAYDFKYVSDFIKGFLSCQ